MELVEGGGISGEVGAIIGERGGGRVGERGVGGERERARGVGGEVREVGEIWMVGKVVKGFMRGMGGRVEVEFARGGREDGGRTEVNGAPKEGLGGMVRVEGGEKVEEVGEVVGENCGDCAT